MHHPKRKTPTTWILQAMGVYALFVLADVCLVFFYGEAEHWAASDTGLTEGLEAGCLDVAITPNHIRELHVATKDCTVVAAVDQRREWEGVVWLVWLRIKQILAVEVT